MRRQEGHTGEGFFTRIHNRVASEFDEQLERVKNQDWWLVSKMWMAFSVVLMGISVVFLALNGLISLAQGVDPALLVSSVSLIAGVFGSFLFYLAAASFLAAIGFGVSIATGKDELLILDDKRNRYVAHSGKLVAAVILFVAYYQYIFKDPYLNFFEFVVAIFAITGMLLLPFGLILWGVTGLLRERKL